MGGVVGGLALIACIAAFVFLMRRIRKVEQQAGGYDLSQWNDGNKAPTTEPVVEQSTRYGTPQALRYPDTLHSGNLQRDD